MIFTEIIEKISTNSLTNITLLCGSIFIISGSILYKFPPKKINSIYGYRTPNAILNQKTWDFSQIYAAKQLIIMGCILLVFFTVSLFTNFNSQINTIIGLILLVSITLLMLLRVEKAIKKRF